MYSQIKSLDIFFQNVSLMKTKKCKCKLPTFLLLYFISSSLKIFTFYMSKGRNFGLIGLKRKHVATFWSSIG